MVKILIITTEEPAKGTEITSVFHDTSDQQFKYLRSHIGYLISDILFSVIFTIFLLLISKDFDAHYISDHVTILINNIICTIILENVLH